MGTSGAYGGTSGWGGIGSGTQDLIDTGEVGGPDAPGTAQGDPQLNPQVSRIIRRLGGQLAAGGGGGGGGGGGRSATRAASVGGRAVAGVNGLRNGSPAALAELGLSLSDMNGLDQWQQAQRLQEVATGASGEVTDSELRLANAEFIVWALDQEVAPTPVELANQWVVEYVWQVWVTEAGQRLTEKVDSTAERISYEAQMRAGLEVVVSASGLPDDRPLVAADFESAISDAIGRLHNIEGMS